MDESLENHINCCRCCSKLLKTGQKTVEISKSIEKRLNDFLCDFRLILSESYSKFICESCNSKLSELWDFKNELNEYQTRLYSFEDQRMMMSRQEQEQRLPEINENDTTKEHLFENLLVELKTEDNTDETSAVVQFKQIEDVNQRNCHICDKSISSKNFYHHMKRKHNSNEYFTCDIDGKKFSFKNDLKSHMKIHLSQDLRVRFYCETCKAPFLSMSALRNHESIFHSEFIEFHPCDYHDCDRVFPNRMKLLQHTITVHGNRRFSCKICQKNYSSSSNLKKHMQTHSERKETCDVCGKSFSKSYIESHLLTHNPPQLKCNFINCGKVFCSKISLNAHSQLHKTNSSKVECLHCNAILASKKSLIRHQATQHSLITIQCELCSFTFKRKDRIQPHYNRFHNDITEDMRLDLIQRAKNNKVIPS